ncbi:MAG: phosphotransferase [Deltaproteobacteria bacterium]|nr:phosphotransferase [Deltaproteobacteria bacterium]
MEFAHRSNEEQVAALQALAEKAIRAWDIDAPRLELIKYRENAVFGVRAGAGSRAVMRVHRPRYRSDDHIRCEAAWMQALDTAGIHTPQVLRSKEGDVLTVAAVDGVPEPRQCDVMRWVDGQPPGTLEGGVSDTEESVRQLYRSVGALAARMHQHGASWNKPAGFVRPSWNVETLVGDTPTFGRFWELGSLTPEQRRILLAAQDRVRRRLLQLPGADVLIHGDLVPDNLLVDGSTVRVIDFDDCGWSWVSFEMVTSLFPLQISGGLDAGRDGYLDGYRSVRAFPDDELEYFPDLMMARGLSYLGWPVGRPEIESVRSLTPFVAAMMTEAAEQYLG